MFSRVLIVFSFHHFIALSFQLHIPLSFCVIWYLGEKALEIYQALMSPLTPAFPCDEAEIVAEHERSIEDAIHIFREETLMDPDVEQFEAYLKEFTVWKLYIPSCSQYLRKRKNVYLITPSPKQNLLNSSFSCISSCYNFSLSCLSYLLSSFYSLVQWHAVLPLSLALVNFLPN